MAKKNPPIEAILVDCAVATGRGLGSKSLTPGAAEFWAARYKKSITKALNNGRVWSQDRKVVLHMAVKLGRVAKRLAGSETNISKAHAKKASKVISDDPTCGAGPSRGRYCPPS